jgi:hypothetical protein
MNHTDMFDKVAFSLAEHLGIQLVFSGQLVQRHVSLEQLNDDFGFEVCAVMISFLHTAIFSLVFSVSPPGFTILCDIPTERY